MIFCNWPLSLRIVCSRFTCVVAWVSASFLEPYALVWCCPILSVYSLVDAGVFPTSANIRVPVFVWVYVSVSPGSAPGGGIAGSHGNSLFNFMRNRQACSAETAPFGFPTWLRVRVPMSPHPRPHFPCYTFSFCDSSHPGGCEAFSRWL